MSPSVSTLHCAGAVAVPSSHKLPNSVSAKDKHRACGGPLQKGAYGGVTYLSLLFHCLTWLWQTVDGPHIFEWTTGYPSVT